MSDLKHRSVDELRSLVHWCERKRNENREGWEAKEAQIEALKEQISKHRMTYNNIGQKMTWARIYLARKAPDYTYLGENNE